MADLSIGTIYDYIGRMKNVKTEKQEDCDEVFYREIEKVCFMGGVE